MLTNELPNHDDIVSMFSRNDTLFLGRWFIFIPSSIGSRFHTPWVSGTLALLALCASAVLIVRALKIKQTIWILLTCVLCVTNPVISNTLAYMFTADAYFISLLLAVGGMFVADRYRFGWIAGGILLGLSLGIYQTYIFTAVALFGIRYLSLLFSKEADDKALLKKLAQYALALALGVIVYMVGLKVMLAYRGVALTSYKGTSTVLTGNISLAFITNALKQIYQYFLTPQLWKSSGMFHNGFALFAFGLSLVLNLCMTIYLALKLPQKSALRYILIVVVTILTPLLVNGAYLVDANSVHVCMQYALVIPLIETMVLLECVRQIEPEMDERLRKQGRLALSYLVVVAFLLLGLNWFGYSNHAYAVMQLQFDSHYALANRMVDRIEQTEGFTADTPVYFSGRPEAGNYKDSKDDEIAYFANTVAFGYGKDYAYFLNDEYTKKFLANYLGVYYPDGESSTLEQATNKSSIMQMPCFPEKDSVKLINGIIVVKLGN